MILLIVLRFTTTKKIWKMKKSVLLAVVSILISLQPIYASFPVSKEKVGVMTEVNSMNSRTAQLVEMSSISVSSIHFDEAITKDIIVPKQERFLLSKQLLKNMVGASSTQGNDGWSIASFGCAILGLFFAAVPMGVLAVIFGAIGMAKAKKGLAMAGFTIGVIDIVFGLIFIGVLAH